MKLKLFDTHTHYDDRAYGKSADVLIQRILDDNVAGFIAAGHHEAANVKAVEFARWYTNVYAAVGIHPHYANKALSANYLKELEWLIKSSPKIRAIGECGLDYHYDGYNRDKQIRTFTEQLELAQSVGLPVIVHSRKATEDTMHLLRTKSPKSAVMHCYSGSAETARELISLGMMISFTGALTFKNARNAVEVCREVPLEFLMLETDCPYMAPEPYRGNVCDSSMAWYTAAKIAEIKGVSTETVVETCNNNAKRFFNIEF
jgi:TatD DNase family protein